MSLARIVRALGGDLYAGGRRANIPAPGHSAADRSVSLLLDGDRVIVHGFGAADWRAVLADLRRRGLLDAAGCLGTGEGVKTAPPVRTGEARRAAAEALWRQAGDPAGTLSERHCRGRGVRRSLPDVLRHHSAVPAAVYDAHGPHRPALVVAVTDPTGALCAVEITYLAADGGRARLGLPRKTVGVLPAASAVRLDPLGPSLLVAEGVFSALSASERFGLPAWALLSTTNLRAWRAPPGVRRVLIAADRGPDGERSARVLAGRLRGQGIGVAVRWPPTPFGDWNEAAGTWPEAGGRDGRGEPDGREVPTDGSE